MAPNFKRVKVFGRSRSSAFQPPEPLSTTDPEPVDLESGRFLSGTQVESTKPEAAKSNSGDNPYLDEYRAYVAFPALVVWASV